MYTPWADIPLGRYPPGRHPPGQTYPSADTPRQTPSPGQTLPRQTTPRQTPPSPHPSSRQPLQWTLRILLECILVLHHSFTKPKRDIFSPRDFFLRIFLQCLCHFNFNYEALVQCEPIFSHTTVGHFPWRWNWIPVDFKGFKRLFSIFTRKYAKSYLITLPTQTNVFYHIFKNPVWASRLKSDS